LKCPLWVPVRAQAQQNGHGIVRAAAKKEKSLSAGLCTCTRDLCAPILARSLNPPFRHLFACCSTIEPNQRMTLSGHVSPSSALYNVSQRRWLVRDKTWSGRELPQHCGDTPRNAGKDTVKDVVLALAIQQEGMRHLCGECQWR